MEPNATSIMELNTTSKSTNGSKPIEIVGYCNDAAEVLAEYTRVYMYVFLTLALMGITANVLNIAVFTRRPMLTPTNLLLTALAVSDLAFLVLVVPYAIINLYWTDELNTYWWSVFDIFLTRTATILQIYSLLLSMALAAWRYIAISRPLRVSTLCSWNKTRRVIVAMLLVAIVGNIPYCLTRTPGPVEGGYDAVHSEIAKAHGKLLIKIAFFMSTVLLRMLPLLVVAVLTILLVKELVAAKRRRSTLTQGHETNKPKDRTNTMLSVVLGILLATIGPHALINFLGGVYPKTFGTCRDYVGYITYLSVVLNSTVNIIVYYLMSHQFRNTLRKMLKGSYHSALIPLRRLSELSRRKNSSPENSSNIRTNSTQSSSQPPSQV